MRRRFVPLLAILCVLSGATARAGGHAGYELLDKIDAELAAGRLTLDEAVLYKFYYVFDPERLPEDYVPEAFPPLKCAAPLVHEFEKALPQLKPGTVQTIEAMLAPPPGARATHVSPSDRFRLSYATSGAHAVPPDDLDPDDGVPDLINRAAAHLDRAWERLVSELAYRPPPASPWYEVDFRDMSAYGYTSVVSGTTTRLTLENDFDGVPPNGDPDGPAAGALKVACAHQFKHASQRATSQWSEGGWIELDAAWAEDVVFPDVDDYRTWLDGGNGLVEPGLPLDHGGAAGQEDVLWHHLLAAVHGPDLLHAFWERRRSHPGESVPAAYAGVIDGAGGDLADDVGLYGAWNMVTGDHAASGVGYPAAAAYPTSRVEPAHAYPFATDGRLAPLSHHYVRAAGFAPGEAGALRVAFEGPAGAVLRLHAVIERRDGSGYRVEVPLDAAGDADLVIGLPLSEVAAAGLALSHGAPGAADADWSLVLTVEAPGTGAAAIPVPLAPPRAAPNPFNPSVEIAFDLPSAGPVALDVLDARGRVVRTLVAGPRPAGPGSARWDGRDHAGRAVASGPYLARLRHGGRVSIRAMTMAR